MMVQMALSLISIHQRGGLSTIGASIGLSFAGALSDEAEFLRLRLPEPTDEDLTLLADVRRLRTLPPSLLSSASAGCGRAGVGSGSGGAGGPVAITLSPEGNSCRPSGGHSVRIASSTMLRKSPVLPAESGGTGMYEWW